MSKECANLDQNTCLVLSLGLIILSLTFLLIGNNGTAAGFNSTNNGPMNVIIRINPGASDPASQHPLNSSTVTVPVGSTVVWVNNDNVSLNATRNIHSIISGDLVKGPSNEFYSPPIRPGEKFSVTLNNTGVFPYYDGIHKHIKGQIIVNPVTTQ
ncbi:MAG TPA: hypothetical protein VE089_03155 [Nitrososphaeraceae archaeon]|jgi:plastocyanin|nr:hypothetical protein [Nitrososphaeraceae archaeon]